MDMISLALPLALLGVSNEILFPLLALTGLMIALALFGRVPLAYVLGNLAVRWRTALMTALAYTLVISLLILMLAFVNGMFALTQGSGSPENVFILSEGASDEGFSNLGLSEIGDIENAPEVRREGKQPLVSRETYLMVNQPVEDPQPNRPKRRFLQLRGITDPLVSATVHEIELHEGGEWFSSAGVREIPGTRGETAVEVVLGEGIARELGGDRSPAILASAKNRGRLEAGDTFKIRERTWFVSGVMKSSGSTFDSELWAKQSLVAPMFGKETITTLIARARDEKSARKLRDFIKNEYTKAILSPQIETDYYRSLNSTNKIFLSGIAFVTIFMAIGGVFGVMNTMFAAVSQRTKDIGVMRLLGYSRSHVLAVFLLEALLIAAIGGVIGCLIGMQCHGWSANSIVTAGPGGGGKFVVMALQVDLQTLAIAMLLTLSMGLLGGLLPSLGAMRLTALETLR